MVFAEKNSINFMRFREKARRELLSCLDDCPGTKAIVWDDYLIGPFSLIAEYSVLQERQVAKMFMLKGDFPSNADVNSMVILIRSELRMVKILAHFLNKAGRLQKSVNLPKIFVYFIPSKSSVCQKALLEICPIAESLVEEFRECNVGAIPLETDLLSVEMESSFRDLFLDDDPTSLHHLAESINEIQQIYGVIPNVYGKGKYAKQLINMIGLMGRNTANAQWNIPSQFDNLVILDRTVDLVTLMPIQLTYEGLIDEFYGINQATVKLPAEKFPNPSSGNAGSQPSGSGDKQPEEKLGKLQKDKKITLNSTDELYAEIRDKNYSSVGGVFSAKTKFLSTKMGERYSAKEVAEMKEFVAQMPHLLALKQSLTTFMTIAEILKPHVSNDDFLDSLEVQQKFLSCNEQDKVHPYIEQLIAENAPFAAVVRLIVLQSETCVGLKPAVLSQYKKDIIHTYGFQEIMTLRNLEKAGLFRTPAKKWYRPAKDALRLYVNEISPRDISYTFSGYAPLSVRLVRAMIAPVSRILVELLDSIPGERTEEKQFVANHLRKRRNSITSSMSTNDDSPSVTLVVFIGGITYAEMSALRHLSNQDDTTNVFFVLTTQMVNGTSVIESLRETPNLSKHLLK